ncbi:MAG: hypothetical protein GTN49_03390, partial [candidate division Zixibacteria bacterium]|nr:hypothetical protein [candidate division Zixibacteria bacterium]
TQVWFEIQDRVNEGTGAKIYADNAMLHIGEFPLKFKPSSGWREMRWDFADPEAAATSNMEIDGIEGAAYPMPGSAGGYLMLKAAARLITPSDAATTYQLCVDSVPENGITITVPASPDEEASNHVNIYTETVHECTDYLTAPYCSTTGSTPPAGGVIFSVWGYYYAS